jgi:hypothetical protein
MTDEEARDRPRHHARVATSPGPSNTIKKTIVFHRGAGERAQLAVDRPADTVWTQGPESSMPYAMTCQSTAGSSPVAVS